MLMIVSGICGRMRVVMRCNERRTESDVGTHTFVVPPFSGGGGW